MDFGTVLSVAQTLFAALQSSQLKEMWSIMGYKSELEDLSATVQTVRAVLLDAEAKQDELSHESLVWLEKLKDAVYDADDLLDEFVTIAAQKQQMKGDKISKKVSLFFSHFNPVGIAYNMSHGVKKIKKKLDAISGDHSKFGLGIDNKPIRRKRLETCSSLDTDFIGREEDVDVIVSKLLDSDVEQDILPIVAMGGWGKTALAQRVFNDDRIKEKFSLRLWACVADEDPNQLDIKAILCKILESATHQNIGMSSLELLQSRVREQLSGKCYLLVLDDVWTEYRSEWIKLVKSLGEAQLGCWIVVTTRSMRTAKMIGDGYIHELQGLSKENSMNLFKQFAFEAKQSNPPTEFVTIGEQIVESCGGVPLAIRVAGSLLYGQERSTWLSFQNNRLTKHRQGQNDIMSILKLSYHSLDSPLKSCFSYCALFPKDFAFEKVKLIRLWIAQGFVPSLEDAEVYFSILLQRCFFQDVENDEYGNIRSCKMHDLIHDVAQEFAGKEMCTLNALQASLVKGVRHVFVESDPNCSFSKIGIRTYLYGKKYYSSNFLKENYVDMLLSKFMCLRTLDLGGTGVVNLPSSIGQLLHLRYLDLTYNEMEVLPKSITRLYNLKTLMLHKCYKLKELPHNFSKLVNLEVLDIGGCVELKCMPLDIGKLTSLHTLTSYPVGKASSTFNLGAQLDPLKSLEKLKGRIDIEIGFPEGAADVKEDNIRGGAYLRNKQHLDWIEISLGLEWGAEENNCQVDALMEEMQPHSNLRSLELRWRMGGKMPSWASGHNLASSLPHLVRLKLYGCRELQYLPSLGALPHLKYLDLEDLMDLEYGDSTPDAAYLVSQGEGFPLLPCLERLDLRHLPKFKGWNRWPIGLDNVDRVPLVDSSNVELHCLLSSNISLPQLKEFSVFNCPELATNLQCPKLEFLYLIKFNERLSLNKTVEKVRDEDKREKTNSTSFSSPPDQDANCYKLREVKTDDIARVQQSLPISAFKYLNELTIRGDEEVENLVEVGQLFRSCSSSLESLDISNCRNLKSLCGGLEHLSCLKRLTIDYIHVEAIIEEKENGMPWKSLHHTLQYLSMQCRELQSVPSWIQKLISLHVLNISGSYNGLKERCQNPTGEDWPLIQHVPNIYINEDDEIW